MSRLDPDLAALQEMRDCVERASAAQERFAHASQAQVDAICRAMAEAGARAAHELARLAVEETGIGRVFHTVLKNLFGSEGTWGSIKDETTVGRIGVAVAAVRKSPGGFMLVPLEAKVPARVNGIPLADAGVRLQAGDQIDIAGTKLELVMPRSQL